jgi:hypothetical protein
MEQAITERIDPAAVQRELSEALESTQKLRLAIEAHLDDAENELAEIRRITPALAS